MLPTKFRFIRLSGFRGEDLKKNRPIRNKNCLWRPCLLMDRDKMSTLYRGPSIYASYQVSVHMVEGFQRRRLNCEKLTDDRRRTPGDGKSSHCLWQGELKIIFFISLKTTKITSKIQISEVCESCDIQFHKYAVHINGDLL